MWGRAKVIGFILILLAVFVGLAFGFHYYFGGGNKTATFGNLTGVVSTIVVPTPPERFVGGTYIAVSDSLRLEMFSGLKFTYLEQTEQIESNPKISLKERFLMVDRAGFEPATFRIQGFH